MDLGVLLCTDLDRTILPNGPWEESPRARALLRSVARRPELTLAYVSGRHEALLRQAITDYDIPTPVYAVGDVGTTIYEIRDGLWRPWSQWAEAIAPDWAGRTHADIHTLFADLGALQRQEEEKQGPFKLSYYTPTDVDKQTLLGQMDTRLRAIGVRASLIWSVDEAAGIGLLDVLPAQATKLHAVRFLMQQKGFAETQTVFAGDSGNDLPVLTSGLQSVLVRNAHPDVREEAVAKVTARGLRDKLYLARGSFLGMNGNYSAGVLEGLAHFLPETRAWMQVEVPQG